MNPNNSPRRWPLLLVMAGVVVAMTATTAAFVTHDPEWRYVLAAGGIAQILGWTLHGSRRSGGDR
ncbi:hypothetical protein [Streptomyces cadmiisoli]|uniref:hypothetical protein n=1 Tax=Streptomyces cadmiisoli TaxID=2184053 RepID=UPI003D707F07